MQNGSFSKLSSQSRAILWAAIGLMAMKRKKKQAKKRAKCKFWVRKIFKEDQRLKYSEYYHLYQTLREVDREFHFCYVRMSKERFDHLLNLISPKICKRDTKLRNSVTTGEHLVITLTLSYSCRVGRTTGVQSNL